jgi:hypothetical protein
MAVVSQGVAVAYRVEVSGWDSNQEFFVERTDLEWSKDVSKLIVLSRPVPAGSLLFLRLLNPTCLDRVHPVPYQADPLPAANQTADKRRYWVRLLPALPRKRVN